jgi:hypothetical protein
MSVIEINLLAIGLQGDYRSEFESRLKELSFINYDPENLNFRSSHF